MKTTIKHIIAAIAICVVASANCFAADYVTAVVKDNLRFFLYNDNTATVTAYSGEPVEIVIPTTVEYSGSTYNVSAIGDNVFKGCKSLKKIKLNVPTIGRNAFESCNALNEIDFENVKTIGYASFKYCQALNEIECPDVTDLSSYAFLGSSISSIKLPNAVTIGEHVFDNCNSLKDIQLTKAQEIGGFAFNNTSITSAILPDVSIIGSAAFQSCKNLINIEIPSISRIASDCFNHSDIIQTIKVGYNVAKISPTLFAENVYKTATLYVPTGMKDKYMQNENWAKFWNIEEYNLVGGVNDVQADASAAPATYYDLNGNKFDTPRQGINIVVDADGNASKQVFK